MSEAAEIVSNRSRYIQFPSGEIALSDERIVSAIMSDVYGNDSHVLPEVEEAVAQLFDALEEKILEERLSEASTPLDFGIFGLIHRHDHVEGLEEALDDEIATVAYLSSQIDKLADFILVAVPGEPSENEGAVDTAIRVIRRLQDQKAQLEIVNRTLNDELRDARADADARRPGTLFIEGARVGEVSEFKITLMPPTPGSFTLKNNEPVSYKAPPSGTYSVNNSAGAPPYSRYCRCPTCRHDPRTNPVGHRPAAAGTFTSDKAA